MSDSPRSVPDWVVSLAVRARDADAAPPFSDQAVVDYRLGARELVHIDETAVALVAASEAEFVVDPAARGRGLGSRMLEQLLAQGVELFWAHGDHPAARSLAASHGLRADRELLHFVGQVQPHPPAHLGVDDEIDSFRVGRDEDEWVSLNARTFAFHPEQGAVSTTDVEQLETEPWFEAENFLVLRRDAVMIGYCWLKVEDDRGEFYVVGVSPDHQGEHLGATLFDAGLARLADLGIRDAHLYVEGDNEPALRLYRARGFTHDSIDVQYHVQRLGQLSAR
jgi:mycothiol synthase